MNIAVLQFVQGFAAAAAAGILLTPFVKRLAIRTGMLSFPTADRWSGSVIPLLGGISLWAATLVAVIASRAVTPATTAILAAASAMFLIGLVDDFFPMGPRLKLLAQVATAVATVASGAHLTWFPYSLANHTLSVVWIVAITNSFNLLDNMDGLSAGVAAIAATGFAIHGATDPAALVCAGALAGACAAFLLFNFKPASIFMGDCGSLFIGMMLALLPLYSAYGGRSGIVSAIAAPVLLLVIPIFDMTFVTVVRKMSGRPASVGGRDHTSHRLVALGFSERQTVLIMYGLAAAGAVAAVIIGHAGLDVAGTRVAAAVLVTAMVLLAVLLSRVKVYGGSDFALARRMLGRVGRITHLARPRRAGRSPERAPTERVGPASV